MLAACPRSRASGSRDLDRLRLDFFLLRKHDLQDSVLVIRGDLNSNHSDRKREDTAEGTVLAFNAMIVLFFGFLLETTLASECQHVVFELDVDVLRIHAGYFGFDDFIIILENINV